jgi:PHD/YefM family antitoxin component YafN of YafNO toxin-antitoxin module
MAEREQYVIDQEGNRTAVLLDVKYYERLVAALEEVESIRAYDEAKR